MTDPLAHQRALQRILDAERPVRRRPDDRPHLWLQEYGWEAESLVELHVHWILERESGSLEPFVQVHQGWRDAQLTALLAAAGPGDPVFHAPLTGADAAFEFPVLVTRRSARSA